MLRQAYQFINNKNLFHCIGPKEEQARLRAMLRIVIQTRGGRSLVGDIVNLLQQKKFREVVTLKMVRPQNKALGWTDEDLVVGVSRIALTGMTKRQKDRALLTQAITLMHELVHIRQFLLGYEKAIQNCSVSHQLYMNIMDELEASLAEHSFEIELAQIYPTLSKTMHLWKARPRWREKYARSFFQEPCETRVLVWIDWFGKFAQQQKRIILESKEERNFFKHRINNYFKRMTLPFSYQDFPLEKVFWIQKERGYGLTAVGYDSSLLFDKLGRLLVVGKGFEKEKESALKFSVFVYKHRNHEVQQIVNDIKKQHPKSRFFLTKGGKEKVFIMPREHEKMQKN